MKRTRSALWLLALWAAAAQAEVAVYYVRHAEGGHNARRRYTEQGIPQSQWPAWVGNPNVFTPDGALQAQALATNLQPFRFDLIAVSPMWRTRNTILPYLKATGQVAEIWPELVETPNFPAGPAFPGGTAAAALYESGVQVELPGDEKPFFRFREDGSPRREFKATNHVDAAALAAKVEDLLRARFRTNDATVLLVGHGNASSTLLRRLTRDPSFASNHLGNACLWLAKEKPGGGFTLLRYNEGAPALAPAKAPPAAR
jgi:broad specificity phosphatase PhoE